MNQITKTRVPILLSALLCPGSGQFIQHRWFAGTFFLMSFGYGFTLLIFHFIQIISSYYGVVLEPETVVQEAQEAPSYLLMLNPLLISLFFYILNLLDVTAAFQRFSSAEREEKFAKQLSLAMMVNAQKENNTPENESSTPTDISKVE